MNIKDHGRWAAYTPEKLPEGAPPNAMFARRVSDGVDWYAYVKDPKSFQPASIKITLHLGGNTVGAAVMDATMLFPGHDTRVLEVLGLMVNDPQALLGNKLYDEGSASFVDPPEPPPSRLDALTQRIEALEGKS